MSTGEQGKGSVVTVSVSMGSALAAGKPVVLTSQEPGVPPKVLYRKGTEREVLDLVRSLGIVDLCEVESNPPPPNATVRVKEAMGRLGASLECEREGLVAKGNSIDSQLVAKVNSRLKDLAVVERALRVLGVE